VHEGEASERELAANTPRNTAFTWPDDAPALHESLRGWFRWRNIEASERLPSLSCVLPHPERQVVWTHLLSPDEALAGWRERSPHQPEALMEVMRWLYVHLVDGSVWNALEPEEDSAPPKFVRVADSLLQMVEATTQHYAARAGSPWRALRFDTTSEPLTDISAPDASRLAAMPAGTAIIQRRRRTYSSSGRAYHRALVGVCIGDDRWLVHDGSNPSVSEDFLIAHRLNEFRADCYRAAPHCLTTAEFSRQLQTHNDRTGTSELLGFAQGTVRVWRQAELSSVLERFRDVMAALFPGIASSLRGPASQQAVQQLEASIGLPLPAELKGLLSWADGQEPDSMPFRMSMRLLPAAEMEAAAHFMRQLQRDGMLQPFWWDEGFLPFGANGNGDYLCLDLRGVYGPKGCVLEFLHDDRQRRIEAESLSQWLEAFVDGLEAGHWDLEDERVMPRFWDGVKDFERLRTPGFPRKLPCDAAALWLPAGAGRPGAPVP
jgi:cell wall assembly regulator SMI1